MTKVNLAPTGTTSNTGTLVGASAHAALSDSSQANYVEFAYGQAAVLTLADLTLPAGALIIQARARAVCKKDPYLGPGAALGLTARAGLFVGSSTVLVTWSFVAQTVYGGPAIFPTDADVDAATLEFSGGGLGVAARVYEASVEVEYWEQPEVTALGPTGTVSDNTPEITWSAAFDADQGVPAKLEGQVRVFTDAVYGGGGFDPETSTAIVEWVADGLTDGGIGYSKTPVDVLPDDTYRAYVRVASASLPGHTSDWEYTQFTVDAPKPGDPTVAAAADDGNGCIEVTLDDTAGDPGTSTDQFQLQVSYDAGSTWADVYTSEGGGLATPVAGVAVVQDHEAPMNTDALYRARARYDEGTYVTYSDWVEDGPVQWTSTTWWMKSWVSGVCAALAVRVRDFGPVNRQMNAGSFRALGSSNPVVVSDGYGPTTGSLTVRSDSEDERSTLKTLLDLDLPILIQSPPDEEFGDRWVKAGDHNVQRIGSSSVVPNSDDDIAWTEVDRPLP